MADNDKYPQTPKGNFHLIGLLILVAIIAVIAIEMLRNPPGEGTAAMPTQTNTAR